MIESLNTVFADPLISRGLLSVLALALLFGLVVGLRRLLLPWIKDEEKRHITAAALRWTSWSASVVILLWIWTYSALKHHFDELFVQRLAISLVWALFFTLVLLISGRIIRSQTLDAERKAQYLNWSRTGLLVLFGLILIRIWAFDQQFQLLRDPLMMKLYKSLFTLGIIYLLLVLVRRFINSLKIDIMQRHAYRKRATYTATLIYFIALVPVWAGSTQQWTTVLSALGAGIALALHEVLLNLAGWVYVLARRPYKTGDRIELGDVAGDVIDIRLFQATLLEIGNWVDGDQSTGRIVHVPHGNVFRKPLYNYTKGFEYLWNEFSVEVTFESDWQAAEAILLEAGQAESQEIQEKVQRQIHKMARDYLIYYRTFTPIVYTKIEASGVKLTLRYLVEAKNRRGTTDRLSRQVLTAFAQAQGIDLAYPTYRVYRQGEGGPSGG